jgi:NADH-quinone oxidoreductase subunit J
MIIESLLFYCFASIAVIAAVAVIAAPNPVHSVIFLILVFCNITGLFILLEVEFLALIFIVVYVGAIAVLFLFVVIILNIRLIELNENLLRYLPIGILIGLIFIVEVFLLLLKDIHSIPELTELINYTIWSLKVHNFTNIQLVGSVLYTKYFIHFLLASIVLLIAIIGAITLTLNKELNVKRQDIYDQIQRDHKITKVQPKL